jgi:AcrR family transcriptional regulator
MWTEAYQCCVREECRLENSPAVESASSREKIITTALRLMAEKGIKQTTLADIARAAQISRGTLFYHYPSKDELIYAVLEKHLSALTDAIFASLPRRRDAANLAGTLHNAFTKLHQDENSSRMNLYLLLEAIVENGELKDRFAVKYQTWRELIAGQIARILGIADSRQLSALGALLLAVIDGLTIQFLLAPQSVNFQDLAEQLGKMLVSIEKDAPPETTEAADPQT